MPELPEVETTRRRLDREIAGQRIERVVVRVAKLRLPLPADLGDILQGRTVLSVGRRGKYLLFFCDGGCLILHLGMTGFLRLVDRSVKPGKHDHVDLLFNDGRVLRFHDLRKFGMLLWTDGNPSEHPLLACIGPEPLTDDFDGGYLFEASRSRRVAVKQFIMNSSLVAGVGNIYANEALFRAGIRPYRAAGSLDRQEYDRLALVIREVLSESIESGSTYRVREETVVYHPLTLSVYGRGGDSCTVCRTLLQEVRLGNRSTVFCPRCQS